MNFCPHCGAKVQDPDSLFCTECGQKMPPKMQSFIAAAQSAAEASFDADSPAPALGGDVSSTDAPTEGAAWQPTQNLFAQADDDAPRGDEATAQFAAVTPGVSGTDDAPAPPPPAPEPEPPAPEAATQPTAPPAQAVTLFEEEDGGDAAPTLFDPEEAPLARPAAPVEKEAPAVPAAPPAGDAAASGEDLLGMIAAAQGEAPAPKQQYTAPAPGAPDLFSQPARQTPSLFEEADTQYIPDPFAEQALGAEPARGTRQSAQRAAPAQSPRREAQRPPAEKPAPRPKPQPRTEPQTQGIPAFEEAEEEAPTLRPRRTRTAPPPVVLPPAEPKRRSGTSRVLTFVALVIIFLVVALGSAFGFLYMTNRPASVVDKFCEAVSTADVETLEDMARLEGVVVDEDSWAAFCAAFSQPANLNNLKSQLLMQAEGSTATPAYPAVSVESRPFLLFIKRYTVTIQGVALLAPDAAAGTTVQLGATTHTGTATPAGEVFSGLMPGRYQCRLVPPGTDAAAVSPVEIEIFGTDGANLLQGATPRATLTIENCLNDDATLYVNDAPVAHKPVGGTVTLPDVPLGSTIKIRAEDAAVTKEATVTFTDLQTTTLRFGAYTDFGSDGTVPPPTSSSSSSSSTSLDQSAVNIAKSLTEAEINTLLGTFYTSYLEAINQQDAAQLKNLTSAAKTALEARIKYTGNASNLFQFTSAACEGNTIQATEVDGVPTVRFSAAFKYQYKPREGEGDWAAGANRQNVELVYLEGLWLVNKIELI